MHEFAWRVLSTVQYNAREQNLLTNWGVSGAGPSQFASIRLYVMRAISAVQLEIRFFYFIEEKRGFAARGFFFICVPEDRNSLASENQ